MTRFSIITVALNSEKYIRKTLQSVADQDFCDYEHIVWDGGSSDGTMDIIEDFPHVKLICGSDSGISDAMNKGAQSARGEFLIHLHSDDLFHSSMVLGFLDTFLRQHPGALWVYGRADIIDDCGATIRHTPFIPYDAARLRKYNIITHPATVVSRKLFHEVGGFDVNIRYCMDYDLWLRLSKLVSAWATPIVMANFREHKNSLSTRDQRNVADEAYKVRNMYVESLWERFRSYRTWKSRLRNLLASR